jgi:hypothetical protein
MKGTKERTEGSEGLGVKERMPKGSIAKDGQTKEESHEGRTHHEEGTHNDGDIAKERTEEWKVGCPLV